MARQRNPRVVALGQVKRMRSRLTWLQGVWTVSGRVYGRDGVRARRADEYPEGSVEHWQRMYAVLADVMLEADDLRLYAMEQIERLSVGGES